MAFRMQSLWSGMKQGIRIPSSSPHDNDYAYVTMDESGELTNLTNGLTQPGDKAKRIYLQLKPGHCVLRKLSVSSLNSTEIEPALELWAEESLPEPAESYYLDNWAISGQVRGLAALPRTPLYRARQTLLEMNHQLMALRVPELCPPEKPGVSIVLWHTNHDILVCLWKDQTLFDWQTFIRKLPARALVEQVTAASEQSPASIYFDDAIENSDIRSELELAWPAAKIVELPSHDQKFTYHNFGRSLAFDRYINEEKQQGASREEKQKLGLAVAAMVMAGLFLLFANVARLEREVAQLQHQVSLLKVRANRSETVAARSGEALTRVRELRAMTTDRQGVMTVLKALGDTLPPRTKLDNFAIERDGAASIDGTAETELDVSTLLERFKRETLFVNPNLTFIQKDESREDEQSLVRFRLETQLMQPMLHLPGEDENTSIGRAQATSG